MQSRCLWLVVLPLHKEASNCCSPLWHPPNVVSTPGCEPGGTVPLPGVLLGLLPGVLPLSTVQPQWPLVTLTSTMTFRAASLGWNCVLSAWHYWTRCWKKRTGSQESTVVLDTGQGVDNGLLLHSSSDTNTQDSDGITTVNNNSPITSDYGTIKPSTNNRPHRLCR